jgi:type I restriction enzyme, R subunit
MTSVREKLLENEISSHLTTAGAYLACKVGNDVEWRDDFDASLGLDLTELFAFIELTQGEAWGKLVKAHGGQEEIARQRFAKRLAQQLDERGTVDVLRHGVRDQNVEIRLSYRKPAFGIAPELVAHYDGNRLTVTRQLPFAPGSEKTVDLCLFVNGIPVATAELKNHLTGQNIEHAIAQYREERDPKNVTLSRRALVHFAVDPDAVAMTTKLEGKETRFLPFNLGHNLGKGNPPNPNGHKTSYLWERVWPKDPWLDILHRFVHVERPDKGSVAARSAAEKVIFPRYHQWGCGAEAGGRSGGEWGPTVLSHPALSGVGEVEHDRLDVAPAVDAGQRGGPEGVRQGRGDYRPGHPRPAASGHDLPVRARPRRGGEDRPGLQPACRGARWRASPHHHHHAAEVFLRAREGGQPPCPQLRGRHRRGALLTDRGGGEGSPGGARGKAPR